MMMPRAKGKRANRWNFLLAAMLVAAGLAMTALSVAELRASNPHIAQATPPTQISPPVENNTPAEATPGGERPTTPAPEPARPDAAARTTGTAPVLPPAPAEKMAPPIQQK
jgi:hypothetical protein